ncbi:MAG: alpha/beta fold hydrolase [Proteobacteria bacterium]|nr:alpha/beta fold hydrolase [Pseudomonadota bacterium]
MPTTLFLHGLDSSSRGSKGRFFQSHFPAVNCPDFSGNLDQRLAQLSALCSGIGDLVLIGSSLGGLMASSFAIANPERVSRLILLAPALNFPGFAPPVQKIDVPTLLVMGRDDTVCPPKLVEPLAAATFSNLEVRLGEDDHLLRRMFLALEWPTLLG